MGIQGVTDILYYKSDGGGVVSEANFCKNFKYPGHPAGANFYIGINDFNVDNFKKSGNAFNDSHDRFFNDILGLLTKDPAGARRRVVLGIEPPKRQGFTDELESGRDDPFGFVLDNLDFVGALALRLGEVQAKVADGRSLDIVVRFASEMNDRPISSQNPDGNNWGHQPDRFKTTFSAVRTKFRDCAPKIKFTFSPAIRADLNPHVNQAHVNLFDLHSYYPGDSFVDIISCTWYAGKNNLEESASYFKSYYLARLVKGKPFGIDEIGGGKNDDPQGVLGDMIQEIKNFIGADKKVSFDYMTFFLDGGFGTGVDLGKLV